MALTSRKYEVAVIEFLYVCPEQCLYVMLRIFCYLLKLVYGHNAGLVSMAQIAENLVERIFGLFDVAQFDVERSKLFAGSNPNLPLITLSSE